MAPVPFPFFIQHTIYRPLFTGYIWLADLTIVLCPETALTDHIWVVCMKLNGSVSVHLHPDIDTHENITIWSYETGHLNGNCLDLFNLFMNKHSQKHFGQFGPHSTIQAKCEWRVKVSSLQNSETPKACVGEIFLIWPNGQLGPGHFHAGICIHLACAVIQS